MGGESRAGRIAGVIRTAARIEPEWQGRVTQGRDERQQYTPWMPFSLPAFIALLAEAMPAADGDYFLEIGCGIGSKLLVARELFGLDAHGFDRVAEYVTAARTLGVDAEVADAREYAGYGKAHIVWFNRVARDPGLQARIERHVWAHVQPGAVAICANLEGRPPSGSWVPVLDDWADLRRGIWQKIQLSPAGW
jgi:hypothetical protein